MLRLTFKIRHLGMIKTCERQGKCKHEHKFEDKWKGNVDTNLKVYVSVNVKEGEC